MHPWGSTCLTYSLQHFTLGLGPEVMNVGKHLKSIHFYMLTNSCVNKCAQKSIPVGVLALGILLAVSGPKPTQFYMLNIFGFNNFPQKSSPGGVLALGLLLAVYGPGLGPDCPGGPEKP